MLEKFGEALRQTLFAAHIDCAPAKRLQTAA
jgi:hypothetical protein